jgi:hypothetical protein
MLKNNLRVLFAFLGALMLAAAVSAQNNGEYEAAASSALTSAALPAGALRVAPGSVPAEINRGLEKIIEASEGKLAQGDSEVLVWAGEGYTKAKAPGLMTQLEKNLSAAGWKYAIDEREGELTFFTIVQGSPARRAVAGYFVAGDEGLVVAWTELLKADSNSPVPNKTQLEPDAPKQTPSVDSSGNLRDLVGKWEKKTSGMSSYSNGNYQGSSGNYESYTFSADGRVEYTSLIAVQNYGCRLEAFSQSKGRAAVNGSSLTVSLGAGTIKRDDSCSRSKNYTKATDATNFTYRWSIEKDEYGTVQLCLTESNGEKYYYRRAQ